MYDKTGNEYVLFANSSINYLPEISDKTAFESLENHIHLLYNVRKEEYKNLIEVGEKLGQAVLESLQYHYPTKRFVVFVSVKLNDSMIIRFHQKWENEEPYYDPNDFNSEKDRVLKFE